MIRQEIEKNVRENCGKKEIKKIEIRKTARPEFGDYTAEVVFEKVISNEEYQNLADKIKNSAGFNKYFKNIDYKPPIFINFFLSDEYLQEQGREILKQKDKFGEINIGNNEKVNVEFISANPTGPLTLGNGRGGFCGDVLTNVLNKAGYEAKREYYINDTGEQIRKLGHSVIGDSEAVYKGEYIDNLRKKIKGDNSDEVGEKAAKIILEDMIRPAVKKMGIKFDVWFSEKNLYKKKQVEKIIEWLKKNDLAYEKDEALWFKSTKFNDNKDRVLIKKDGEKTYITSDAAYLKDKFERGFKKLIYIWGADHFGYIERVRAMVEALGYKKEQTDFIIMQLVRLFEKGKEVRMSKRTGTYVTLDELINEVGLDVARYFFLSRSHDTHLNFDLDLAKEQSEKNPVYYIQYAYARICSIFKKTSFNFQASGFKLLNHQSELDLIKQLIRLPEIVEDTAKDYQVQRIPQYATDLAASFHQFYRDCKVISDDEKLTKTRLGLVTATKIVLKNTLDLMGISAPEKM